MKIFQIIDQTFSFCQIFSRLVFLKSFHNRAGKIYEIPDKNTMGRAIVLFKDYLKPYRRVKLEGSSMTKNLVEMKISNFTEKDEIDVFQFFSKRANFVFNIEFAIFILFKYFFEIVCRSLRQ